MVTVELTWPEVLLHVSKCIGVGFMLGIVGGAVFSIVHETWEWVKEVRHD